MTFRLLEFCFIYFYITDTSRRFILILFKGAISGYVAHSGRTLHFRIINFFAIPKICFFKLKLISTKSDFVFSVMFLVLTNISIHHEVPRHKSNAIGFYYVKSCFRNYCFPYITETPNNKQIFLKRYTNVQRSCNNLPCDNYTIYIVSYHLFILQHFPRITCFRTKCR